MKILQFLLEVLYLMARSLMPRPKPTLLAYNIVRFDQSEWLERIQSHPENLLPYAVKGWSEYLNKPQKVS